jgi:hypothetical protein
LYDEMLSTRLAALGPDLGVPVFIFQGSEDPHRVKTMVLLQGGRHFAVWSMADRFREELVARVRPSACAAAVARTLAICRARGNPA